MKPLQLMTFPNLAIFLFVGLIALSEFANSKGGSDDENGTHSPKSVGPSPTKSEHSQSSSSNSTPNQSPNSSSQKEKASHLKSESPISSKQISPNASNKKSPKHTNSPSPSHTNPNSPNISTKKSSKHFLKSNSPSPSHSNPKSPTSSPSKNVHIATSVSTNVSPTRLLLAPNRLKVAIEAAASSPEAFRRNWSLAEGSPVSSANSSPSKRPNSSPTTNVSLNFNNSNAHSPVGGSPLSPRAFSTSSKHLPSIDNSLRLFVPALSQMPRNPTPFPSAFPSPQSSGSNSLFPLPPVMDNNSQGSSSPAEGDEEPIHWQMPLQMRLINVRDARCFVMKIGTELANFYEQFHNGRSLSFALTHNATEFVNSFISNTIIGFEFGHELRSLLTNEFWTKCMHKFSDPYGNESYEEISKKHICMMGSLLEIARNISIKLRDYEQKQIDLTDKDMSMEECSVSSSLHAEHGSSRRLWPNLSFGAESFAGQDNDIGSEDGPKSPAQSDLNAESPMGGESDEIGEHLNGQNSDEDEQQQQRQIQVQSVEKAAQPPPVDEHLAQSKSTRSCSSSLSSGSGESCEISEKEENEKIERNPLVWKALNLVKKCIEKCQSLQPTGMRILSTLISRRIGDQQKEMPPATASNTIFVNPAHNAMFGCMQSMSMLFICALTDWKNAVDELHKNGQIDDKTFESLFEMSTPSFAHLIDESIHLFTDEERRTLV